MEKKNINRRDFIKIVGISTATVSGLFYGISTATVSGLFYGCGKGKSNENVSSDPTSLVPVDKMTYRTSSRGDKVSLLGYGCMRWPTLPSPAGDGNVIDQDAVNELIDYAMAHGVNYYDTSPVYVQGWSEKSTGIALKRHPRDKFYVATKLSNFSNYTRENSLQSCRISLTTHVRIP